MNEAVYKREEGELIPQGVSCTETELAYYIYIRNEVFIRSFRVQKVKDFPYSSDLEYAD